MALFVNLVGAYRRRARAKRARLFRDRILLKPGSRVLDLGSEDGSHIHSVLPPGMDVYIADIDSTPIELGAHLYGYTPILIKEDAPIPFPDEFFEVVFCSSTIEHATVSPKDACWRVLDQRSFDALAKRRQLLFAGEIRRVGQQYFVQTPNRRFPIESHSWMPGLAFLPRAAQVRVIRWANTWWVKKTMPDFRLLTSHEMKELFPDSVIHVEKSLGLTKSIIAVKANAPHKTGRTPADVAPS